MQKQFINKYLSNKIKLCDNDIKTDFLDKTLAPKETPCLTYSLITIDSVVKVMKAIVLKQF